MAVSGCLFLGGSIPSVVPFCFLDNDDWGKPEVTWATVAAGCGCLFFLFMVGFIKVRLARMFEFDSFIIDLVFKYGLVFSV